MSKPRQLQYRRLLRVSKDILQLVLMILTIINLIKSF